MQNVFIYVNFISGEQGIDVFHQEAERRNICIATSMKVPSNANNDNYIEVFIKHIISKKTRDILYIYK